MNCRFPVLRRSARASRWLCVTLALWMALAGAALAQPKATEEAGPPSKSYVLPYVIVLTAVGIGLMVVLRPSSRADKIPDQPRDEEEE